MSNANATGARGLQYTGTLAAAPPNCNFVDRDPTPYDNKGYSLLDQWLNIITKDGWVLVSLAGTPESRGPLANWVKFTGAGLPGILSITGDDGIPVFPNSAGNFNILGTFPLETFTGDPSFPNSLLINVNIATEMSLGVTTLAGATVTIAGTSQTTAVDPRGLSAKLGTQTEFGVAYGNGGIGTVIGWTNSGTVTQVLTSNGPTDPPTFQDAQEGFNVLEAVRVATTGALTVVYNNGAAGVGATLTNAGVQAALAIDGVSLSVNDRVLVKDQVSQFQNGIYTVTAIGSGATNWVMTRSLDYDMAPSQIQPGNIVPVIAGTTNANTIWLQTATVTTIGTDPIIFVGFGSQPVPLPIALGGTNTTSFSVVNGVVIYNGTELATIASTGSAGQVLVSNGAAAPTFQTIVSGAGALVLLQTQTISSPTNVIVFTAFSNTYNNYLFQFDAVDYTAAPLFEGAMFAQLSNDGGATYFTNGYLVAFSGNRKTGIAIGFNAANGSNPSVGSPIPLNGSMNIYNATSGGNPTTYTVASWYDTTSTPATPFIATTLPAVNAIIAPNVNAIRFFFNSSGASPLVPNFNMISGSISMYGYTF